MDNKKRTTQWPTTENNNTLRELYLVNKADVKASKIKPPEPENYSSRIQEKPLPTQAIHKYKNIWDLFEPFAQLEHGGWLILAQRKTNNRELVAIIKAADHEKTVLQTLLQNHHENLVMLAEALQDRTSLYVITDLLDVCLAEVISAPVAIQESQAAFICGEVNPQI